MALVERRVCRLLQVVKQCREKSPTDAKFDYISADMNILEDAQTVINVSNSAIGKKN